MTKPSKSAKPRSFFVNGLTGCVEMRVTGSLHQSRLEKKVRAIFAALPEGSFVAAPKALWRLYFDCDAKTDAYEIRFVARDPKAVEAALRAL